MNLNVFADLAHRNAAEHGWYDPEPEDSVIFANIMGEWAEAFEEYKAGKPDVYRFCSDQAMGSEAVCEEQTECYWRKVGGKPEHCSDRCAKPEGIAAELIDGAIRILDYIGWQAKKSAVWSLDLNRSIDAIRESVGADVLMRSADFSHIPKLICELNVLTGYALDNGRMPTVRRFYLCMCLALVFNYAKARGIDAEKLMLEKHEYNKSRTWRHGGKKA